MQWFSTILLTLQVISSLLIIVLVLLQQGKGADMGAAFGSGSAGSVFGSAGAANFLSRATKWAAVVFFATTIGLAWVAHHPSGSPIETGIMQGFSSPATPTPVPAGSAVPDVGGSVPAVPSSGGASDAASSSGAASSAAAGASADAANSAASVPSVPAPAPTPATSGAGSK
ncbi:preprotein translocase subunit SecG [Castellaniella sp.]|uniref:preprotein translocase subunit SecG n=1 Tax=Castellaniella sp. TaxID=1955812 RepID=UPI003A8E3D83